MADLVSLAFIKQALRIAEYDANGEVLEHEDDDVIQAYLLTAEEAVLRYLKDRADPDWTEETAPQAVRMSIVMFVHGLYDGVPEIVTGIGTSDPKNPIVAMLSMLRKPTLV